jgi:CheY-like chemotaxis protein
LVKGLVEMHGGTIEARSEGPGTGSEFIVRLPAGSPVSGSRSANEAGEKASPVVRRRILIVDDNRLSSESTAMLLRLIGHDTTTAHDGGEGLERAEAFRPEIVLLDIGLPGLNGYAVARRLREQPWGRNIFLIAVTGYGQEEDQRRSVEAGFDHHMVKPINMVELLEKLSEVGGA